MSCHSTQEEPPGDTLHPQETHPAAPARHHQRFLLSAFHACGKLQTVSQPDVSWSAGPPQSSDSVLCSITYPCRSKHQLQTEAQTVAPRPRLSSQEPRLPGAVFQMPQTLQPLHLPHRLLCASPHHCSSKGPRRERRPASNRQQPALSPCTAPPRLPSLTPPSRGSTEGANCLKSSSDDNATGGDSSAPKSGPDPQLSYSLSCAAQTRLLLAK